MHYGNYAFADMDIYYYRQIASRLKVGVTNNSMSVWPSLRSANLYMCGGFMYDHGAHTGRL